MSRRGNPYDNAFVESFMKTLKAEEVDCNEYATLDEAQAEIGTFIERIYNRKRLHSALGHVPPPKFSRHRQIYRSAGGGARLGKAGCGRVFLGGLLSSSARLRFPGRHQNAPIPL